MLLEGQMLPSPQDYCVEENLVRGGRAERASDKSTEQTSVV